MNKKIKFRVWDKQNEYFVNVKEDSSYMLGFSSEGEVFVIANGNPDEEGKKYEIQHFTGFKDFNDKEVAVGDVMIHSDDLKKLSEYGHKNITSWQIVYEKPEFIGRPILKGILAGCSFLHLENLGMPKRKAGYIVIGNINENPELLGRS